MMSEGRERCCAALRAGKTMIVCALVGAAMVCLAPRAEARELKRRTVTVTDTKEGRVPTLHVAPAIATVLAFESDVRSADLVRDNATLFHPLTRTARTVVVVPKKAVTSPASLSVSMSDGTIVSFALLTVSRVVDSQIDVKIDLSSSESAEALRSRVEHLDDKLKECESNSDTMAVDKMATLIVKESGDGPQAFETHPMRGTERESRLRMEAKRVYRMLGYTYVVLTVNNRDPRRKWVLGKAVVHLTGGGKNEELTVAAQKTQQDELASDAEERVVVAFKTPGNAGPNQHIAVALQEKDGARRVELKDLEL